jgi:hypothetical protein
MGQLPKKRSYPYFALYGLEAHPVYSGASFVGANKLPGMIENISPKNLVVKCVEAIGRFLLGLDIQLPL